MIHQIRQDPSCHQDHFYVWNQRNATRGNPRRSRRDSFHHIVRSGVIFGNLTPIFADPSIDPPFESCINCWSKDHRRDKCPFPEERSLCLKCGRCGVTIPTCLRCAEPHFRDIKKFGEEDYQRIVEEGNPFSSPRTKREKSDSAYHVGRRS